MPAIPADGQGQRHTEHRGKETAGRPRSAAAAAIPCPSPNLPGNRHVVARGASARPPSVNPAFSSTRLLAVFSAKASANTSASHRGSGWSWCHRSSALASSVATPLRPAVLNLLAEVAVEPALGLVGSLDTGVHRAHRKGVGVPGVQVTDVGR